MSERLIKGDAVMSLADPARRVFSLGLGLFPMLPLLPGCGATIDDSEASQAQLQAQAPQQGETRSAPTPGPVAASVSGVFRHSGLLVTEDDASRIRELIKNGQQPWTDWWNKLCSEHNASLDAKPNPQPAVYRADSTKYALYGDIWHA